MENKLEEYALLTARMKADKARLDIVKAEIEEELGQNDASIKNEYGTFKMVSRTTWKHSDAIKEQEEELKMAKQDEIEQWDPESQTGPATPEVKYSLRLTPAKKEE